MYIFNSFSEALQWYEEQQWMSAHELNQYTCGPCSVKIEEKLGKWLRSWTFTFGEYEDNFSN